MLALPLLLASSAVAADYAPTYEQETYDASMRIARYGGIGYGAGVAVTAVGLGVLYGSGTYEGAFRGGVLSIVGLTGTTIGTLALNGGSARAAKEVNDGGVETSLVPGLVGLGLVVAPVVGSSLLGRAQMVTGNYDEYTGPVLALSFLGGVVLSGPFGLAQHSLARGGHDQLAVSWGVAPLVSPEGNGLALGFTF